MLESKKNPQLDLRKDQLMLKILGYSFVFMVCNVIFSFTIYDKNDVKFTSEKLIDDVTQVILRCPTLPTSPPMPKPVFINDFKKGIETEKDLLSLVVDSVDNLSSSDTVVGDWKGEIVNEEIKDETIYDFNDLVDLPTFIGGSNQLNVFLETNLIYPNEPLENEIEGVIMVNFVINKDGTVSNVIAGPGNKDLQREAVRIIQQTNGKWNSGRLKGQSIRVRAQMPITFSIN